MVEIIPEVGNDSKYLKLADAIQTSAAIIASDIFPSSQGSGVKGANTILVRYLQAVNFFSWELKISREEIEIFFFMIMASEFPTYNGNGLETSLKFLQEMQERNLKFISALTEAVSTRNLSALKKLKGVERELKEKNGVIDLYALASLYRYHQFSATQFAQKLRELGLLTIDGTLDTALLLK